MPLDGVDDLSYTVSSPLFIRGVAKVPAGRGPELGEHTDQVLAELGFSSDEIDQLGAEGVIPGAARKEPVR